MLKYISCRNIYLVETALNMVERAQYTVETKYGRKHSTVETAIWSKGHSVETALNMVERAQYTVETALNMKGHSILAALSIY